jgi:hypothetical protein
VLRLAYLGVTNAFTMLRLLRLSDHETDAETLALRHQVMILQRHLDERKVCSEAADWALQAATDGHVAPPAAAGTPDTSCAGTAT